jgi:hypothetical protein
VSGHACCAWISSQDLLRDPAAGLAKLRAAGPVVEVRFPIIGKTWITTTKRSGRPCPQGQLDHLAPIDRRTVNSAFVGAGSLDFSFDDTQSRF